MSRKSGEINLRSRRGIPLGQVKTEMHYEVRFQISGEEQVEAIEADDAASAARRARDEFSGPDDMFELIQVQLLEDISEHELLGASSTEA